MSMRLAMIAAAVLISATSVRAETFRIDPGHSYVGFSVTHLAISHVKGQFNEFSGTIDYDPADTSSWMIDVTIQAASIDTRNEGRDDELRGADFLNTVEWPHIHFTFGQEIEGTAKFKDTDVNGETWSQGKVVAKGDNAFDLHGLLTMNGITKPVILHVENLTVANLWGSPRMGLTASTTIDRMDYGVSWNKTMDTGGLIVGPDVDIQIEIEAGVPKEEDEASDG